MNKQNQLAEIDHSGKPYIIYKSAKGFNLFTDFSKRIILNNKNIKSFLEKKHKVSKKNITSKTEIKIGIRDGGYVEVLSGLIEGENIVAEGLKKVRPRGEIKPIKK